MKFKHEVIAKLLERVELLGNLSDEVLLRLVDSMEEYHLAHLEVLKKEHDWAEGLVLVQEGLLQTSTTHLEASAGDILHAEALLYPIKALHSIVVLSQKAVVYML